MKTISPQKITKKVLKSIRDVPSACNNVLASTDYSFKATELNEQKKGFLLLYFPNFHICIV